MPSNFDQIKGQLLRKKALFEDKDFPPNDNSLYGSTDPFADPISWKRATDIGEFGVNAQFINDGATRFDLDQGRLGNCWFISSVATLTTGPANVFERVVPSDQHFFGDYAGIFRFNFWWYGNWKEVYVDDFLPCDDNGLIYCRNREHPREFWVALLEKAYAKLNGSYEALNGGKLQDAMMDLTGGIAEVIDLQDKYQSTDELYKALVSADKMNSLIGGNIKKKTDTSSPREIEKSNGLYSGHAYSITSLAQVEQNGTTHKLLRVLNPWGMGEWNGPWSDKSTEMKNLSDSEKKRLNFTKNQDGEFWISIDDFLDNFDEVSMCHLQPDAMLQVPLSTSAAEKSDWKSVEHHGAWVRGLTAGGCGNPPNQKLYWKNPQYVVEIKQPDDADGKCTFIVSLMQKYWSKKRHVAIGFDLYWVGDDDSQDKESYTASELTLFKRPERYQFYRDMCTRFRLKPGKYAVICSTFEPHKEAAFLLRMYSHKPINSSLKDAKENAEQDIFHMPQRGTNDLVASLFKKHCGIDGVIDARELLALLAEYFSKDTDRKVNLTLEMCRSLLVMMDVDRSGFLGSDEVRDMLKNIKLYTNIFGKFDKNNSGYIDTFELANVFRSLGFPLKVDALKSVVRRYATRDNGLSFEDFIMAVCRITTLYFTFSDLKASQKPVNESINIDLNQWLENGMLC